MFRYGVVVLLCLFQVLKFAAMSTKVNLMWLTVHRAMQQIGIFLSFFTTIYLAYVFAGHLMFGPEVYEFSTFALSLRSMLFIILGQYRYSDLQRVNQYLAPVFVISYVTLVGYGAGLFVVCCCWGGEQVLCVGVAGWSFWCGAWV